VGERARPVVLVFLLLAAVSLSLALRASLLPPRGTVFAGTFFYVDDFYNYLSYVEQAQRGELVFRNKLADPSLPPALVNLEWLAVGWISALLGGSPLLAYRVFGLGGLVLLVWSLDHWLVRAGLPRERRSAGLLLATTGGGLGGALYAAGLLPGERALDARTGLFPVVEVLANPHFVAGTALLLAALAAFAAGRPALGAALGTVLGLVRPYDAALLAGVETLAVLAGSRPALWPRGLRGVAALVPVLAYDAWLFLAGPGFSAFSAPAYAAGAPGPLELVVGAGPATLLALTALRPGREGSAHRLRLALWAALALLVAAVNPVSFATQLLVGAGAPLLVLAAVGLAGRRRFALEAAVPLMATTGVVVAWLCTRPSPAWFVREERLAVTTPLREACRPGERLLAPPDVGLFAGGLTPCWPFVSHAAAPGHLARADAVRRFYSEATPSERADLLDRSCAAHVVLAPRQPRGWLPEGTPFRPRPSSGTGLSVWSRGVGAACAGERW
jgi:hypothetical protein